jgi:hypothetical protein
MKPRDNVEEAIRRKLRFTAASTLRDRWRKAVLRARDEHTKTSPALREPTLRSAIMKNSYVKLALAAVVILAVVLGVTEFLGPGGRQHGWEEGLEKTENCRRRVRAIGLTSRQEVAREDLRARDYGSETTPWMAN